MINEIRKAIWKMKHGFWYVPREVTKYKTVREKCYPIDDEGPMCHDNKSGYHYTDIPIEWRRTGPKKHTGSLGRPDLMITSKETWDKLNNEAFKRNLSWLEDENEE